jgi:hypothetical protein
LSIAAEVMFRKSRRTTNWFAGLRRQSPQPAVSSESVRSVEEQEFFVEPDAADRVAVRGYGRYGRSGEPDVERFEQPEFADMNGVANGTPGQTAVQDVPDWPSASLPPNPPPRNFQQRVQRGLNSGKQVASQGVQRAGQYAQQQAIDAFDRAKPVVQRHRWSFLSIGLLTGASVTAVGALVWLSRVPPVADCNKIGILSSDSERLYCAQMAAQSGDSEKVLAAMNLVKGWSKDHPMYPQATSALAQWSELLLIDARERLANNDLDGAVKLAQQIPSMSPIFGQVQEEINFWQVERNRGQQLFEKIQTALRRQLWNDASTWLAKLATVDDASWQTRLPNLRKQLADEKQAGVFLSQAKEFAQKNPVEKFGDAIRIVLPMNRQTFVWEAAQKQIQQWRDQLLDQAAKQLRKNDLKGANQLISALPMDIEMTPVQQDLVRVARATTVGTDQQNSAPLLNQLWGLMVADTATHQVNPSSPYYKQAQALRPRLEQQAEDVVQIQIAQGLANLGQLSSLDLAIAQVSQLDPKRPRRLEAQTRLATWRKDAQVLEDRPVLKQSERLAKAGGLDQLRAAVILVDRIPKGRSIYGKAQGQKAEWVAQIQTIEDKPILNEARSVAQSGKLGKAIQIASGIRSGRALYGEAQESIWGWSAELQAIVDRERLAQAQALAAQGSLTRAIGVAAQINSGAVAGEAQQSIGRWSAEREEIRRSAPAEPAPAPAYEPAPEPAAARDPEPYYEPAPAPAPAYEPAPADEPAPEPAPAAVEVPTEPVADPVPPTDPAPPL